MADIDAVSPAQVQGGGGGLGRNASRGAFIVLEGVDRCGKSTQAKRLVEDLNADGVLFLTQSSNELSMPSR